jgi:RNA polymerase sigma-70 factor, ECF subfamily
MAPQDPQQTGVLSPEATSELLVQVRQGDRDALDRLLERCLPPLRRWAHGRLPPSARGMRDTADLVQDAVIGALGNLQGFEARHEGALQAYLRQAVMNKVIDAVRFVSRRPQRAELQEDLRDPQPSPLEQAIGADNIRRYEAALGRLAAADREAIIARIELQYTYEELAVALDKASPDAARMAVTRAMKRLAEEMRHG